MRMSSPPRGAFSHGLSTGSHSSGRSIREVTDCTGSSMLERPQLEGKCLGALTVSERGRGSMPYLYSSHHRP